jgi:hypothetical protein
MRVPVVQVGIVDMPMAHRSMPVPMRMRFGHRSFMLVLVMFVVDMAVLMLEGGMSVHVLVALGQMQPQADPHQDRGDN